MTLLWAAPDARASLLIDNFQTDSPTNALGGPWQTVTDGHSTTDGFTIVSPGDASAYCGHFDYTMADAPTPFVRLFTFLLPTESTAGIDVSAYEGLRFSAKGTGTFLVELATTATAAEDNFFSAYFSTPANWTEIQVPFSLLTQTFGTTQVWDPTTVYAVVWVALDRVGASGQLSIDNVEFYAPGEASPSGPNNPVIPAPKVNQIGYLSQADKIVHLTEGPSAKPGGPFDVLDVATGRAVMHGTLATSAFDDGASTGESVLSGDFSTLTTPGRYAIAVGGLQSPPFVVDDDAYASLFRDAIRAFYIIRCGVAIDDPQTGIQHPACHTADAALRDDPSQSLDLTGGWHNAGDFGKWTHEAAISASYMMWLYELNASGVGPIHTGIPESGNGV